MSIGELADVLGLKESYLQNHWTRVVRTREKDGILFKKIGRGENAKYAVHFPWMVEDDYAWTIDEVEMP